MRIRMRQHILPRKRLRRDHRRALTPIRRDPAQELRQQRRRERVRAEHDLLRRQRAPVGLDLPLPQCGLRDGARGRIGLQVEPVLVDAEADEVRDELEGPEGACGEFVGGEGAVGARALKEG